MNLINQKLEPKAKGDSEVFVDDSEDEIETESGMAMKTAESRGWVAKKYTVGKNHKKSLILNFHAKNANQNIQLLSFCSKIQRFRVGKNSKKCLIFNF